MSVLMLMMLLIVTNIITRSFGRVITPAYELIEIMAGIAISFCIVYVTLEKGNIVVDFVVTKLPQRLQSVLHIVTSILGMGTWILIAVASFIFANRLGWGEKTDLLGIPIMPARYIWIIALVILCLIIFIQLVDAIGKVISKWTRS
jgi:TRAP-type C4-dicarboxylate transport system permease small subunit